MNSGRSLQQSFYRLSVALVFAYILVFATIIWLAISVFIQINQNRRLIEQDHRTITVLCDQDLILNESILASIRHIKETKADQELIKKLNLLYDRSSKEFNSIKITCKR